MVTKKVPLPAKIKGQQPMSDTNIKKKLIKIAAL